MRASSAAHGTSESIRSRNRSRLVLGLLVGTLLAADRRCLNRGAPFGGRCPDRDQPTSVPCSERSQRRTELAGLGASPSVAARQLPLGRPARKSHCSDLPCRWRCPEVKVGSFRYLVRARPEPPSACGISPRGAGGEGKWRLRAGLLGGSSWIGLLARCGGSCHGVTEGGFPAPQRGGPPLPPACAGAGFGISPHGAGKMGSGLFRGFLAKRVRGAGCAGRAWRR